MNEVLDKINSFIAKHGNSIDKKDMPIVTLTWKLKRKDGNEYMYVGINEFPKEERYAITFRANSYGRYAYFKYDKEIDVAALCIAQISTSRVEPTERQWIPLDGEMYYIVNHQKALYDANGVKKERLKALKRSWPYAHSVSPDRYFGFWQQFAFYVDENMKKEIISFLGEIFADGGIRVFETHPWCMGEWFKRKDRVISKKSEKILTTELPEIKNDVNWFQTQKNRYDERVIVRISKVQDLDVIRVYRNVNNEYCRIYIGKNKTHAFINTTGEWKPTIITSYAGYYSFIVPVIGELTNNNYIKYIKDIIARVRDDKTIVFDISKIKVLMDYPIIEKLYKAGYTGTVKHLLVSNTIKANIKDVFGKINENGKTIYDTLMINKHQLDLYELSTKAPYYHITDNISSIKSLISIDDLSSLDNETFDAVKIYLDKVKNAAILGPYGNRDYAFKKVGFSSQQIIGICKRLYKFYSHQTDLYQLITDTLDMYLQLRSREIEGIINIEYEDTKTVQDLNRMHDYYMNLLEEVRREERARWNMAEAERRKKDKENFAKKLPLKIKKFNFEGSKYLIKYPENPETELPKEGMSLRHCVSGYVDRQLCGTTNILFLRKKEDPDQSFMTIEVCNDEVVQIHGYANRWLGSCEETIDAIPFVLKWLVEKNIKCSKKILTSTATGYCSNESYISLPKVDFDISNVVN